VNQTLNIALTTDDLKFLLGFKKRVCSSVTDCPSLRGNSSLSWWSLF